ncbi:MAG: hypothetical protein ACE5FH_10555 [Candidatus Zixiibacteriota bacterium]
MKSVNRRVVACLFAYLILSALMLTNEDTFAEKPSVGGRPKFSTAGNDTFPWQIARHTAGRIGLIVSNHGVFGGFDPIRRPEVDYFTGEIRRNPCEFPEGSNRIHLWYGSLWVGAVVDGDTIVSTGLSPVDFVYEMLPTNLRDDHLTRRSTVHRHSPEYVGAVSHQDFIAQYTDTMMTNIFDEKNVVRNPRALPIEVTQRSYVWSFGYAQDIVFFDCTIRNIGKSTLEDLYVALHNHSVVSAAFMLGSGNDNLTGFLSSAQSMLGCDAKEAVNVAWVADADGDPYEGEFIEGPVLDPETGFFIGSVTGAAGFSILSDLARPRSFSYNWWVWWGYGPSEPHNNRPAGDDTAGYPLTDRMRYHVMRNREVDFDQAFTYNKSFFSDTRWSTPPLDFADQISTGIRVQNLLSYGSFDLPPGASFDFAFAYVAGERFHTAPDNFENLPGDPFTYYSNLDFSDLSKNALWAQWIYDNPGVDTDHDGYAGEYRICVHESTFVDGQWTATVADTLWYKGDGVPDWRAAQPPPPPNFWLRSMPRGLHVRINGARSENEKDIFVQAIDFEGYRVYLGRDDRETSLSLIASFDRPNFDKWTFNSEKEPRQGWDLLDLPFTLEQLRCLYGSGADPCNDSTFDPLLYHSANPYQHPQHADSIFFFQEHDFNAFEFGVSTPIHKTYPDEVDPRTLPPGSLTPEHYTEDGYLKFYEYEMEIDNLLPTLPYFVSVTAFDYGSPETGVPPLESSITDSVKSAFAFGQASDADVANRDVYIYPNPYRKDARYRARGLEGRTDDRHDDRVRRIHFANLPPTCTIRIFTIDGDMVREITHDIDPSDPLSSHDTWDLISRNGQPAVSGLYYWSVESDTRTQLGKLVIIR